MSTRGSRGRFRRDDIGLPPSQSQLVSSSSRFDDKSRPPPPRSRHLWVGNLSPHVSESILADLFIRFGELDSVSYQPGRSFAFINFVRDVDAFEAVKALKDFDLAGSPLRIQFAKAEKSSAPSRDESFSYGREERRSPFLQRESRLHAGGRDADYFMNSKAASDASDPSEVLWIGFPAFLKVDEMILRKAFSPFGEIEKITAFPGRTYAFVRFRTVMSACRAKETLEGKLFGNPRVHICFARSESGGGLPNAGRRSFGMDGPQSPHSRSNGRGGSSDDFGLNRESYGNPDAMEYGKRELFWSGRKDGYDRKRIHDFGPEPGYGRSPGRNGSQFHDFSPPRLPRGSGFHDEPWDSPNGPPPHPYSESKRLKTGHSFPLDNELPDYGLSDAENSRYGSRNTFSNNRISDYPANSSSRHFGDKGDDEFMSRRDSYQPDFGHSSFNRGGSTRRLTPDLAPQPPSIAEWKWQGIIAKGGTPVCRARCFPVGKVLDFALPELLDCTARTGLDMLAKHYYQAAGNWVVFFVPESDGDISHYSEFLHFLEEKQRVAVAKLNEQNTLFLVPPSEFSEKVLKVPGKLSISGVILRLEPAAAPALPERNDHHLPSHRDAPYPSNMGNSSAFGSRHPSSQASMMMHGNSGSPSLREYDFTNPSSGQQPLNPALYNNNNKPSAFEDRRPVSTNFASGGLQPDQIALLAASLLGQQQSGQLGGSVGLSEHLVNTAQRYEHRQNNQQALANTSQNSLAQQPPQLNAPESDPQRLQATLQLAAALLQQIHQGGKGP